MGNKFEVWEYYEDITAGGGYRYHIEWHGESVLRAIWIMWKLKRDGAARLKLVWRP